MTPRILTSATNDHDGSPATSAGSRSPAALVRAADVSWRLLVILALVGVVGWVLFQLSVVVIPLVLATLFSAVLVPTTDLLAERAQIPRGLAAGLLLAGLLGVLGMATVLLWTAFAGSFGDISRQLSQGVAQLGELVTRLPVGVSPAEWQGITQEPFAAADTGMGDVVRELTQGARTLAALTTETILGVIFTFFLAKDGRRLGEAMLGWFGEKRAATVRRAVQAGFGTLRRYLLGLVVIGLVNATMLGLCLWALGMPLVLPLTLLTFLGSLVPMVGPTVTGAVAVLIAVPAGGIELALLVLGAAVFVQQVEGNLLQPYVMGRAVALHPLVVLVTITVGVVVLGVAGAFVAVPLVAGASRAWAVWRRASLVPGADDPGADDRVPDSV